MTACLNRAWTALQRAGTLATQPCTHEHLIPFGTVPHILAFVIDARLQFWKNGFQHQWVDAREFSFYHDSNLRYGVAVPITDELCNDDTLPQQSDEVVSCCATLHGLCVACDVHGAVVLTHNATDDLHETQQVLWQSSGVNASQPSRQSSSSMLPTLSSLSLSSVQAFCLRQDSKQNMVMDEADRF